jgi:hypothetical protein
VFTGGFGQDTITNFSPLHDNIVQAQAMFANFGAVQSSNEIALTGVAASRLHASDFRFV